MDSLATQLTDVADRLGRYPATVINRVVGAALAAPSWMVLGLASWLTPSPTGVGTHTQLGMGECLMLHVTGYPCPMCGMTTTFTLLAHFRPIDAALNQPFGPFLFSATVVAAVVGGHDLLTGGAWWRSVLAVVDRFEQKIASAMLVLMMLGWVYKVLLMHPELRPW